MHSEPSSDVRGVAHHVPTALRPPGPALRSASVGAVALLSALLIPPNHDDGWILERGRLLGEYGISQSIDPFVRGSVTAVGRLTESAVGRLATLESVLAVRAVSIAAVVLTWLLLEHLFHRWRISEANRWVGLMLMLMVVPSVASSLRPEPVTGLLLVVILLLEPYRELHLRSMGLTLWIPSAIALSVHQTGWAVVVAALWVGARSVWTSPLRGAALTVGLWAAGLVAGLAIVLHSVPMPLFILSSQNHVEYLVASGASGKLSFVGFFNERARYLTLLDTFTFYAGRIPHLVVAAFTAFGLVSHALLPRERSERARAIWVALFAALGLAFTNSKWIVHLLALTPIAVVVLVVVLQRVDEVGGTVRRLRPMAAVLLGFILLHGAGQQGGSGLQIPLAALPWDAVAPSALSSIAVGAGGVIAIGATLALGWTGTGLYRRLVVALGLGVSVIGFSRALTLTADSGWAEIVTDRPLLAGAVLPLSGLILVIGGGRAGRRYPEPASSKRWSSMIGAAILGLLAAVMIIGEAQGSDALGVLRPLDAAARPWSALLLGIALLLALLDASDTGSTGRPSRIDSGVIIAAFATLVIVQTSAAAWGTVSAVRSQQFADSFGASHIASLLDDGRSCDLFERLMSGQPGVEPSMGDGISAEPAIGGLMPCRELVLPRAGLWGPRSTLITHGTSLEYFREIRLDVTARDCRRLPEHKPVWANEPYAKKDVCVSVNRAADHRFSGPTSTGRSRLTLMDLR